MPNRKEHNKAAERAKWLPPIFGGTHKVSPKRIDDINRKMDSTAQTTGPRHHRADRVHTRQGKSRLVNNIMELHRALDGEYGLYQKTRARHGLSVDKPAKKVCQMLRRKKNKK